MRGSVMGNCLDCKFAEWRRTSNGRLHPDKTGVCTYKARVPIMPAAIGDYHIRNVGHAMKGHQGIERDKPYTSCAAYVSAGSRFDGTAQEIYNMLLVIVATAPHTLPVAVIEWVAAYEARREAARNHTERG